MENVPWFVGGGAKVNVGVARLLAFAAFGGAEGIIGPKDLQVREQSPTGTGVRVMPGACAILNRAPNVVYEAYAGRAQVAEDLQITATGAAERSDLIVARVEDPFENGQPWTVPSQAAIDAETAKFIFPRVISGVDKTATPRQILNTYGYSAIPLGMVTLPPNTSVVQQSHITDLRFLSQPQRAETLHIASPTADRPLTQTAYGQWIVEANHQVTIPEWATHVRARAILGGVRYGGTGDNAGAGWNVVGNIRVDLGGVVTTAATVYNTSVASGNDRTTLIAGGGPLAIPTVNRGSTVTCKIEATKSTGNTSLVADTGTTVMIDLTFTQRPESAL